MLYIDTSFIDKIHQIAIEHGDESEQSLRDAIRDDGCVPAICEGDFFEDPIERAAYYMHRIATRHPYVEGNKRTAFLTAQVIIKQSTGCLIIEDAKVNNAFVRKVANDEVPLEEVCEWLRCHITRLAP